MEFEKAHVPTLGLGRSLAHVAQYIRQRQI